MIEGRSSMVDGQGSNVEGGPATPKREALRRVVVTGIGAITLIGATIAEMWDSLVAGRSGVDYIKRIDASTFPTTFGAEVRDVDESRFPADDTLRAILDRKNLFGWVAAADALSDSRILDSRPERIGVSL